MASLKEQAQARVGRLLGGKYALDSVLGIGGMASVYAGRHRNGSRVAVKVLHAEFVREEQVVKRFQLEGYVANKVEHPGRVAVLDDDMTEEGEPFLVMELLSGETLEDRWKRYPAKRMKPVDALWFAEAILDVLQPFHEQNVVHRDLKPANVFITREEVIKLLDFGVAKMRIEGGEGLTQAGTALGTPSYMSPEQAQGKSDDLDGRSDVFSVGATLYALLSGARLYHDKSDPEAFILAATQPAPSLARVAAFLPAEVIAVVDRSMHWDRRKRFQTANEMKAACRKIIDLLKGPPPRFVDGRVSGGTVSSAPPRGSVAPAGGGLSAPPPPLAIELDIGPATAGSEIEARPAVFTADMARRALAGQQLQQAQPEERDLELADDYQTAGLDVSAEEIGAEKLDASDEEYFKKLKDVFTRVEKLVPVMRQYGPAHPYTRRRVEPLYKAVIEALRMSAEGIRFTIEPFCFTFKQNPVWEPDEPEDLIPYTLCRSGVEEVQIAAGVTERELYTFFQAVLLGDPDKAGGDITGAIWEARLEHIFCHVREDYADADAQDQDTFFSETDDLMGMAQQDLAEVAAMAVTTDSQEFVAAMGGAAALRLDSAAERELAAKLSPLGDRWNEAFFDVFLEAHGDAATRGDARAILEPLATYARDLARYRRFSILFNTHTVLLERVAASPHGQANPSLASVLTTGMFPVAVIKLAFRMAGRPDELPEEEVRAMPAGLTRVAELLDASVLLECIRIANELPDLEPRRILLGYVDRVGKERVHEVVAELDILQTALAQRILEGLTRGADPQVIEALRPLLAAKNKVLRCEATAWILQSPEHTAQQLMKLISQPNNPMVDAALATLVRHNVRPAGPRLVQLIQDESFARRETGEQKLMLGALFQLHQVRGENLCMGIVAKHGIMLDEQLDRLRIVAAEMMGQNCDSPQAIEALEGASKRRPWNGQALRDAANKALAAIQGRKDGTSPGQVST